jgi:16S rRNA (cytidine(1402)-2'-O)-methyltransferase
LQRGERIALVSDAGTPAIADPGARLVRAARERGLTVVPIPGPSAITAALSVAGMSGTEFTFMGFPPAGGSERRAWFEKLTAEKRTTVFFEAPHRIHRTLIDVERYCGKRPILAFREISKINEEFVIAPIISDLQITARGEFVLVAESVLHEGATASPAAGIVPDIVGRLANNKAFSDTETIRIVAAVEGVSERTAARLIKKHRILVKRGIDSRA